MDPLVGMILSISGVVIMILLGVIGFFLARVVSDVKSNTSEIGKCKGKIELVEQQLINDVKRIEALTQMELKTVGENMNRLSDNVGDLTNTVNTFIKALAHKGIDTID